MPESDSSSNGIYDALNNSSGSASTPSPASSPAEPSGSPTTKEAVVELPEDEVIEDEVIEEEYIEDEIIEEEVLLDEGDEVTENIVEHDASRRPTLPPIEEGTELVDTTKDAGGEDREPPPPPPAPLSDRSDDSSSDSSSSRSTDSGSGSDDEADDSAPPGPPPPPPRNEDEEDLGPPPPPPPGWDEPASSSDSESSSSEDSDSASSSSSTSTSDSLPIRRTRGRGIRTALYVATKEVDDVHDDDVYRRSSTFTGLSPSIQAMLDAAAGAANISVGDAELQPGAAAAAKAAAENAPTAKALTLMERKKQLMQRKKAILGIEPDIATEETTKSLSIARDNYDEDERAGKSRKGKLYRKKPPKLMVVAGRGFLNKKMAAQSAQDGSDLIADFLAQTFENFTEEQKQKELRRQATIKRKLKRLKQKKEERTLQEKRRLERLREKKKVCQDGDYTEWYKIKLRKKKNKEKDRKKAIKIVTSKYESDPDDYGEENDKKQNQGDGASRVSRRTGDHNHFYPNDFEYQYELLYSNDEYSFSSKPSYTDDYSDVYSYVSNGKGNEETKADDGDESSGEYTYSDSFTDSSDEYNDRINYRKKLELQKRTLGSSQGKPKKTKVPGKILDRYIASARKKKKKKKEASLIVSLV